MLQKTNIYGYPGFKIVAMSLMPFKIHDWEMPEYISLINAQWEHFFNNKI